MDKRFLVGIAYNLLIEPGSHRDEVQLSEVRASNGEGDARHRLYHDPLIRLPRDEMMRDGGDFHWRNKPILVNHGGSPVGRINSCRIVDGRVEISAEVTDPAAIKRVDDGDLGSFSVGYDVRASADGKKRHFDVKEVSLCHEPFFEGCTISVVASKHGSHAFVVGDQPPTPAAPPPQQQQQQQQQQQYYHHKNEEKQRPSARNLDMVRGLFETIAKEQEQKQKEQEKEKEQNQEKELTTPQGSNTLTSLPRPPTSVFPIHID